MGDLWNGKVGKEIDIADLPEHEARMIFGDRVYEAWLKSKEKDKVKSYEIEKINTTTKTVTLKIKP